MKRFDTFALALAIVFTLIISGSHHVFAADLITGGPLAEDMPLRRSRSERRRSEGRRAMTRRGLHCGMDPTATTKTTGPSKFPARWTSSKKAAGGQTESGIPFNAGRSVDDAGH